MEYSIWSNGEMLTRPPGSFPTKACGRVAYFLVSRFKEECLAIGPHILLRSFSVSWDEISTFSKVLLPDPGPLPKNKVLWLAASYRLPVSNSNYCSFNYYSRFRCYLPIDSEPVGFADICYNIYKLWRSIAKLPAYASIRLNTIFVI